MQGVSPIGPQVYFSPPQIGVDQVKNKPVVELLALEKGPELPQNEGNQKSQSDLSLIQQLKLGDSESTAPKLDLQAEIMHLRAKAQSEHIQDQKEAVAGFARLAKSDSESARNYGLIGMLSILRLSANTGILSSVASNLILLLDPSLLGDYHSDLIRFTFSILSGLSNKFDQLPKTQQNVIMQRLTQNVDKVKNLELQARIREFLKDPITFGARMAASGTPMPIGTPVTLPPATQVVPDGALVSRILQKQQSVLEQVSNMDHGTLEVMASIFSSTKVALLEMYSPYLLSDTVLIHALGYMDTISKEVHSYRRRKKQKTLAFVTHFSAVLPKGILEKYPIFVVDGSADPGIRQYHDLFMSIIDEGYKHVVVLMPHAEHWLDYHHAKHAAHKLENVVHVVDTQLFGLGLGLLIQELCARAMKARSVKILLGMITRLVQNIRYWIVPLMPGSMKNQLWYQKMTRKLVIYDSAWESQIPVIALSSHSGIVSRSPTPTKGLLSLQEQVQLEKVGPLKMVIEHRDLLPEASAIGRYFQQQFPHCEITIAATSLNLGQEWGPFVGVSVLYP